MGLDPTAQPPGRETKASPHPASKAPKTNTEARNLLTKT
jgi:hypothetical protein